MVGSDHSMEGWQEKKWALEGAMVQQRGIHPRQMVQRGHRERGGVKSGGISRWQSFSGSKPTRMPVDWPASTYGSSMPQHAAALVFEVL